MSIIKNLFNRGMQEIEKQEQTLEKETDSLLEATSKATKAVDKAVTTLESARAGANQGKDNITWLEIEIDRNTSPHSFKGLKELYTLLDSNQDDLIVFEHLTDQEHRKAKGSVEVIIDGYQDKLNAYDDEIEQLESLITEHASESNLDDLQEVIDKYRIILGAQVSKINKHLNSYNFDDMAR